MKSSEVILFLDIDGVLNSTSWLNAQNIVRLRECPERAIDPRAVARLNTITARTQSKIVVSSSWRITFSWEHLKSILAAAGVEADIIGHTPVWMTLPRSTRRKNHPVRATEIQPQRCR